MILLPEVRKEGFGILEILFCFLWFSFGLFVFALLGLTMNDKNIFSWNFYHNSLLLICLLNNLQCKTIINGT